MSQFDQTTEKKAHDWWRDNSRFCTGNLTNAYRSGRNSAKESLEILARALLEIRDKHPGDAVEWSMLKADAAIYNVRARGDWPLGDT